jgi:EAL domain-containing protein (putative c-di-GMP-specific phosphodiesterase class I)/CheY-like chemotaxis protein
MEPLVGITGVGKPRALLVDDEEALLRAQERMLTGAGYEVVTARDGAEAAAAIERTSFDVIFSDIDMPRLTGLELLDHVRAHDLDVPVVLITGRPGVDTAIRAIERGALRYLVKPVALQELVKVADYAVRLHRIAKAKRMALELAGGVDRFVGDRSGLAANFDRAIESLHIAYQPIVSWSTKSIYGYEALLRSREPSLPHPGAVLDAAERLDRVHDLGRLVRMRAIHPREPLAGALLFLNLHPADLMDDDLFLKASPLAAMADRVVLEITERASLDGIRDVRARIASLRKLGFRIAVDDLGAGYAGLTSFTTLEPDIVKLDMALVRDVHREPKKQKVVRTMITMCKELGITVTSEGIETAEERDELAQAGCDLMQGYLFAKPGDAFPVPVF